MIVDQDIDLLVVTETWLKEKEEHIINEMVPTGYKPIPEHRSNGQSGGGLIAIHKSNLKVEKIGDGEKFKTFEYIELLVTHNNFSYRLLGVYRAPPSVVNRNTVRQFLTEFETFLIEKSTLSGKIIILGDLNIHLDDYDDKNREKLIDLITSFNLRQRITEATHDRGHILDVVIDSVHDSSIKTLSQDDFGISDHQLISVQIENVKPRPIKKTVTYKKTRGMDLDGFKNDIKSILEPAVSNEKTVDEKVKVYNSSIKQIFDKYAPDKTKTITIRPNNGSWYTEEIRDMKRKVRKLERNWRRTKNENCRPHSMVDDATDTINSCTNKQKEMHQKTEYKKAKRVLNNSIKEAKNNSLKKMIDDNKDDTKELFKIVSDLISPEQKANDLPDSDSSQDLASSFSSYFQEKISNIRNQLKEFPEIPQHEQFCASVEVPDEDIDILRYQRTELPTSLDAPTAKCPLPPSTDCSTNNILSDNRQESTSISKLYGLKTWSTMEVKDIVDIICKIPKKSCKLDPCPTWLLKECVNELAPTILDIVNSSLVTSTVPLTLKKAIVKPLLKKPSLCRNQFKNYRPVSNLPTLAKILEKVVCLQLNEYLDREDLRCNFQSAYRKHHSTESALIKVHNDIVNYVSHKETGVLILLDLSAAFDTIDHGLLLRRLHEDFHIQDEVLNWFHSYLSERTQSVNINECMSCTSTLEFGVPQGSVLGPLLFTLYTKPIGSIISSYGLCFHTYADDTQIYFALTHENKNQIIKKVEACINHIKKWMVLNKLKLNEDKTDIISFNGNNRVKVDLESVSVAGSNVTVINDGSVRNLGVNFDSRLNMSHNVNKLIQSCHFHLKRIRRIRHLLDQQTTKILMSSFVLSRIDYCNAILWSSPAYVIDRVQKLQNMAARIVCMCGVREHITPVLKSLHWLPVHQRIQFKILSYTYKCKHDQAPHYLKDLLKSHKPQRSLRSMSKDLLTVPNNRSHIIERAFEMSAPMLWNNLPPQIKQKDSFCDFKRFLKAFLFNRAFN